MVNSLMIACLASLQLIGLLVFQLLVIRLVGVGPEMDVYFAAQALPSVINSIIGSSLQSVWLARLSVVPKYDYSWQLEQSLAQGQGLIVSGVVASVLIISSSIWIPLLYPGFNSNQHQNAIAFSVVFICITIINTQSILLTAALRASNRFLSAEIISLLGTSIALIGCLIFIPNYGIWAAVWIWLLRSLIIYILQMHIAGWIKPAIVDAYLFFTTWHKIKPLLVSSSLVKFAPLVDRYWASLSPVGGLTILGLAQQGMGGAAAVLERAISMPLIPELSRYVESRDFRKLRTSYRNRVFLALIFSMVIIAFWLIAQKWIISLIGYTLELSIDNSLQLWNVVAGLIGYLFVSIAGTVAVSVLYAMGEMFVVSKISVLGFFIGIILKWQFFEAAGLVGLSIAISFAYLASLIMTVCYIEIKLKNIITNY
jgi:peptidoglycan biosynthesis protein MviN/MurJ (putative lipid II flippase)